MRDTRQPIERGDMCQLTDAEIARVDAHLRRVRHRARQASRLSPSDILSAAVIAIGLGVLAFHVIPKAIRQAAFDIHNSEGGSDGP